MSLLVIKEDDTEIGDHNSSSDSKRLIPIVINFTHKHVLI
jgi:hypothetical protein